MSLNPFGNGPGGPGPSNMMAQLMRAMNAFQAGNLSEAELLFKLVLAGNKRQFEATHFLGVIAAERGRLEEAADLIGKSLKLDSGRSEAFSNYARVLNALKRNLDALAAADKALALNARNDSAQLARGNALIALGRFEDAIATYDKALSLRPNFVEALSNRGLALSLLGRHGDALASLDRALALSPDHVPSIFQRGRTLQALSRNEEALTCYQRALVLAPDNSDAAISCGGLLRNMGRYRDSATHLRLVVGRHPELAEAHYQLGLTLVMQGESAPALDQLRQAVQIAPDHDRAKFDLCMAQLPALYRTEAEIAERRESYREQLLAICADPIRPETMSPATLPVGALRPFYLPYQGQDDRELQSAYGSHLCRIMASAFPSANMPPPARDDEPVRVGMVSGLFESHSVWKIPTKGWLSQLDRNRFRIFGYNTATGGAEAAALCERFVHAPKSLEDWRKEILADAPHVLIYPEIGMDPTSAQLAAMRLAPVQCLGLGHPETTGYPTLDCFLTSDLMEPEGAEAHYTERLVRLPNLSIYYEPVATVPVSMQRNALGLRPDATVYWACQSLYKFLPQYDQVFPRIARAAGNCQFVFVKFQQGEPTTELFRGRLQRAFADAGLKADDHCVILPRQNQQEFIALAGLCDVVLDSIGWSGFNTTLETLAHDLPVVTWPGAFARGRHSAAVLRMMGVTETIADSMDQYVDLAVRLGRDRAWRDQIKASMRDNKQRVYRDRSAIAALEQFLTKAARNPNSFAASS